LADSVIALEPQAPVAAAQAKPSYDIGAKRRKFRAFEANKDRELKEAQEHRRYYHAKQWTEAQVSTLNKRKQPVVTDNRVARKIDFLVGIEQRMRRDPKGYPRTPKHEVDADAATASVRYVCDVNRWEKTASDCCHDGMVSNCGVVWIGIEAGEVKIKQVDVSRFFYDPRSIKADFSDARFMGVHLWMDIDEATETWPQHAERLKAMVDNDGGDNSLIRADQDQAEQWADFEQQRVRVLEFWERKAGQWSYCFFTGDIELDSGPSPYVDEKGRSECPYIGWSSYVDEKGDRYGIIRNLKSMQDEINHRRSKFLHMINVRQVHVQKGTVDDIDHLRQQLSRPDGVIEHNGEWGKTIGMVDQSDQVKGQAELLVEAQTALENLGPNPGLIGKGGGVADQSGRAILAQRDSGMTELSPVFERLRDWKLRCYRAMWARIRQAWTGERFIRVTDDRRSVKFVGINTFASDPMTGEMSPQNFVSEIDVDIIMDEGPDTIVMKEELLQTMSQLGEAAAGPMGKIMIELSNVPDKEALLKMIDEASAPPPQMVAMEARMAELEARLKAVQIDEKIAAVENKRADTLTKLAGAMTPQQQQTDEIGMPVGPPPADPAQGLMTGLQALSLFPLQYREPLREEMASMPPEPPMPQPGMEGAPPEMGGAPQDPMQPPMDDAMIAPDGGMPIDPSAFVPSGPAGLTGVPGP
jgi:hypothetical protein